MASFNDSLEYKRHFFSEKNFDVFAACQHKYNAAKKKKSRNLDGNLFYLCCILKTYNIQKIPCFSFIQHPLLCQQFKQHQDIQIFFKLFKTGIVDWIRNSIVRRRKIKESQNKNKILWWLNNDVMDLYKQRVSSKKILGSLCSNLVYRNLKQNYLIIIFEFFFRHVIYLSKDHLPEWKLSAIKKSFASTYYIIGWENSKEFHCFC